MTMLFIFLGLLFWRLSYADTTSDIVYDYNGYNNGSYGSTPNRTYVSSDLKSPIWQVDTWKPDMLDQNTSHILVTFAEAGEKSGPKLFSTKDLSLVYSLPAGDGSANAMIQKYRGEDYLTYWAGSRPNGVSGSGIGACYFLNNTYQLAYTITPIGLANSITTDNHECQMTTNDTVIITIYKTIPNYDLTSIGGPSNGTLLDSGFQEIDVATNTSLITWWASEHFDIIDTYATYAQYEKNPNQRGFDFFHLNSVQKIGDDFILSGRLCSLITYVNHTDGEVIWTLGGRNNQFQDLSQGNALSFAFQHHVRIHDTKLTELTMFDNHGTTNVVECTKDCSRGLFMKLDTSAKTVRVLSEVYHPQSLNTAAEGSFQLQSNKNSFVGWGFNPSFVEATSGGEIVWDAQYGPWSENSTDGSYRTLKANWVAYPPWKPDIAVQEGKVYVSWNGATEVKFWDLVSIMLQKLPRILPVKLTDDSSISGILPPR